MLLRKHETLWLLKYQSYITNIYSVCQGCPNFFLEKPKSTVKLRARILSMIIHFCKGRRDDSFGNGGTTPLSNIVDKLKCGGGGGGKY